jgi:hypothetical protein
MFSGDCFVGLAATKQFSGPRNHFVLGAQTSGNGGWLSSHQQERRTAPAANPGDSQMRTLSFILAFAFVLAGPSMAGSVDSGLPGVGTFAYTGAPIGTPAPHAVVMAAR